VQTRAGVVWPDELRAARRLTRGVEIDQQRDDVFATAAIERN
jgi:hypothetical protein